MMKIKDFLRRKLFIKSKKNYKNETDIVYILEKIQELEKFKLIILSPEQFI